MKTKQIICTAIVLVSLFIINSCSTPTCKNSKSEYQDGYSLGKTVKLMGESYSCSSFVKIYNEQAGRNIFIATDCFCEGYKDGLHSKPIKF
jgi:hypothetical protein